MQADKFNHQSQCVTFRLDQSLMGVNILDIREIVSCRKITAIARAPEFVMGLMNLRGQILTVLDIGVLFGFEKRAVTKESFVIIFKQKNLGFIVDRIGDVVGVDPAHIESIPANIDPGIQTYMAHVINLPEELLMMLDAEKILSDTLVPGSL